MLGDARVRGRRRCFVLAAAVLHDVVFLLDFDWRPRIRVANLQMRTLKVEVEDPCERLSRSSERDVPHSAPARGHQHQHQHQRQHQQPSAQKQQQPLGSETAATLGSETAATLGSETAATLGLETAATATAATAALLARTGDGGSWSRGRPFLFLEETHVFCLAQDEMWGPWGPDAGGRWGGNSIFF